MSVPALVVVHEGPCAAVDGMVAAEIAAAWGAALGTPPAFLRLGSGDEPAPHAAELVTEDGALVANGLLWADRALGPLPGAADAVLGAAPPLTGPTVIALDPAQFPGLSRAALERAVAALAPDADWISVHGADGSFGAVARLGGAPVRVGRWRRDAYGRPVAREGPALRGRFPAPPAAPEPPPPAPGPHIAVIAEPANLRDVSPAVLAALGDAADALGIAPRIELVSPRGFTSASVDAVVAEADGLVLPGGTDIEQVAGQIAAAAAALEHGTPVFGICLGMQSMAVAFARAHAGLAGAGLEELAPDDRPLVFERLRDAGGTPRHRLGARTVRITPGSRLAEAYGTVFAVERLDHRYRLAPSLMPTLADAGLAATATGEDDGVVDGIEVAGHRFFLGLQGNPEQASRPGRPHPLFTALLRAAAA